MIMEQRCPACTDVWEEGDEFLHVEPDTLQSREVCPVHPLDGISTDDVSSRNSDDHVSHTALWSNVRTYPPVFSITLHNHAQTI